MTRELIKLGVIDSVQESEIERQEARTWRHEVKELSHPQAVQMRTMLASHMPSVQ